MDTSKTHGAISWSELTTSDPVAAAEFYGTLFGWTFDEMDMGPLGSYHVAKLGDTLVAGMQAPPPGAAGSPPGWGSYITVTDVDKTVAQAVKLGAKVCMPVMDVPGVGRMAGFSDPQGAVINVITYSAAAA